MMQHYANYDEDDHRAWNFLFKRQSKILKERACEEFFVGLELLENVLTPFKIPKISDLSIELFKLNGWSIEIVDQMLPVEEFFFYLSKKKWLVHSKIRVKGDLNFSPEVDIFHDVFGHIPLLANKNYAEFLHKIGNAGYIAKRDPLILRQLQRLFYFTIDYGVIKKQNGKSKIYGAGILSSYSETNCFVNKRNKVKPYGLVKLIQTDFSIDKLQNFYAEIDSFDQLHILLEEYKSLMIDSGFLKFEAGYDFTDWLID